MLCYGVIATAILRAPLAQPLAPSTKTANYTFEDVLKSKVSLEHRRRECTRHHEISQVAIITTKSLLKGVPLHFFAAPSSPASMPMRRPAGSTSQPAIPTLKPSTSALQPSTPACLKSYTCLKDSGSRSFEASSLITHSVLRLHKNMACL